MMISLTDLLMTINSVFIIGLCVHYFKSNYKILDIETYNQVADICEEYTAMVEENQQLDDGGTGGFFREYLEEDPEEEEYEEEDPDEEDSKNSVHSEPKVHPEPEEAPKKKRGRKAKTEDRKVGF